MSSATTTLTRPELPLGVLIAASGAAKLAGAEFTKQNFKRWGYADWWRPLIGAIEVGTGAAAAAALITPATRKVAAIGTLSTMGGAIATHTMAGEPKYSLIPALLLSGLAVASLYELGVGG